MREVTSARPPVREVTSARAPGRVRRWKPALLSATVFPGLGQLANGHRWRALFFGGTSAALLVVFVRRIARETLARMPSEPEELLDPALPFRLLSEIQRDSGAFFFWTTVAITALWLASVADAWLNSGQGSA